MLSKCESATRHSCVIEFVFASFPHKIQLFVNTFFPSRSSEFNFRDAILLPTTGTQHHDAFTKPSLSLAVFVVVDRIETW